MRIAEPLETSPDMKENADRAASDSEVNNSNTGAARAYPLPPEFRYIHHPLVDDSFAFLGKDDTASRLTDRLRNSDGGTFLVSGFRGVGKTTVARRALTSLEQDDAVRWVTVSMNVAKPVSTNELLFGVVRRLFERLVELRVLDEFPEETQRSLLISYMRTSLQMTHSTSDSTERSASLSLKAEGGLPAAVLGRLLPGLQVGRKKTSSLATEASFLAYSESDVEYDFLRTIDHLKDPSPPLRRWWHRRRSAPRPVRLVVVLDELDKLTATQRGRDSLDEILIGLKNVLASGGAHFVLISGPDLQDRVAADVSGGLGLYESVFSWQTYVPCQWTAASELTQDLLASVPEAERDQIAAYLEYRGRGIMRRLLQAFNEHTNWTPDGPQLQLDEIDLRRIQLTQSFQSAVRDDLQVKELGARTTLEEDRRRLAKYLAMEWVSSSSGRVFEAADVVTGVNPELLGEGVALDPQVISSLLERLAGVGILARIGQREPWQTHVGDIGGPSAFALSDQALDELLAVRGLPGEFLVRRIIGAGPATFVTPSSAMGALPTPGVPPPPPPISFEGARRSAAQPSVVGYELNRRIGQGASGTVYEATAGLDGRAVAVKILERHSALADPRQRARFEREMKLALSLRHPNVVETIDSVATTDGRLGLVMELASGPTLADLSHPLDPQRVLRWGVQLAKALQYLSDRGVGRIDLKPNNIILRDDQPVIIDLGIAKPQEDPGETITVVGELIGTPAYMAPEQFSAGSIDIRADIYALGVVLFELLGGTSLRPPLEDLPAIINRTLNASIPVSDLDVSEDVKAVLGRATATDRADRYTRPGEMAHDLVEASH